MQPLSFEDAVQQITSRDPRYHREAYLFLREALDHTQKLCKDEDAQPRHVTGQELLVGLREYALAQFGPMARLVLNNWGVFRCEDFGEIVFNMVRQELLSKTADDSPDDFKGGYDFEEAFCKPFRPRREADQAPTGTQASQP